MDVLLEKCNFQGKERTGTLHYCCSDDLQECCNSTMWQIYRVSAHSTEGVHLWCFFQQNIDIIDIIEENFEWQQILNIWNFVPLDSLELYRAESIHSSHE